MKKREKKIATQLLNSKKVNFDILKEELNISRRTLYYDIERINDYLKGIGTIIIKKKDITISGDFDKMYRAINKIESNNYDLYLIYLNRKSFIIEKILRGFNVNSCSLASSMYISEITIKNTIKRMKDELLEKGVYLTYQNGYRLNGSEKAIRELFLETYYDSKRDLSISEVVNTFDKSCSLRLTDYSKNSLTAFTYFVTDRVKKGNVIKDVSIYEEVEDFKYYKEVPKLFDIDIPLNEQIYTAAFVSSLSCLNTLVSKKKIEDLVDRLIDNIEKKLMIYFKNKDECKKNMLRHIASSYYRIKYKFPIHNPLLEEIKYKFGSLFIITKNLFNSGELSISLKGIRDEEVAFIVSYLGSYIFKDDVANSNSYKVLIACPNGITISKTIQYQLEKHFPELDIIDTISISEINDYEKEYDYLISTIEIKGIDNIIVVNTILRNFDLDTISKVIFKSARGLNEINIEDLIEEINKYSTIKDEKNLKKYLYNIIYETNIQIGGSLMLKETLLPDRIKFLDKCENWEVAIKEASLPLLEQGAIEEEYIQAMIDSVHLNGPYIVIDDYFALAHARPSQGVNRLSMSLLKINNSVDFLGKEVKVIVVLAATDNKKHLQALASLTELFMERENLDRIINAKSIQTVVELIEKYS